MCVIIAIPAGTEYPSDETLRACWNTNSDGAGFMYSDGKQVVIRKGFMKWEDFANAIDAEMIPKESAVVMHFRIATSGKVQPKCCHPFPISDEKEDLQATEIESRFGIAHNGVISGRFTTDGWSDTMDFVADVVTPLMRMNPGFMHNEHAIELLEGACRSKLAILDNAGDMVLVGEFTESDGVFYSNTNHLWRTSNWSSYQSWWTRNTDPNQTSLVKWNDSWSLDDDWDDDEWGKDWEEKQLDKLPWKACQLCPMCYDCIWGEECDSEAVAVEVVSDLTNESVADIMDACDIDVLVYE